MISRFGYWALAAAVIAWTAGPSPADAQDKLKIAAAQKGAWDTSFPYLGQQKGYFKEVGIELDIQWTDGGADTLQAVVTGSFDIGLANGILGVIGAWAKNAPIVIISAEMTGSPDAYWYVKADHPAKTLKDLEGKTIAYSRPGSSTNLIAVELLKVFNMNAKLIAGGGMPAVLTQVMSGQLDAGWAAAPINLNLVKEGKIRVVASGNDAPSLATQTVRVNVANKQALDQRRAVFLRFMAAYKKTIDWAYEGADFAEIYAKFAEVDPSVVPEMRTKFAPRSSVVLNKIGDIDGIIQQAVEGKRLDRPLTDAQKQDMLRYVAELNR